MPFIFLFLTKVYKIWICLFLYTFFNRLKDSYLNIVTVLVFLVPPQFCDYKNVVINDNNSWYKLKYCYSFNNNVVKTKTWLSFRNLYFLFNSLCTFCFEHLSIPQWRSVILWTLTSIITHNLSYPENYKSQISPKRPRGQHRSKFCFLILVPKFILVKANQYKLQTQIIQGKMFGCVRDISWLLVLPPGVCQKWKHNLRKEWESPPIIAPLALCSCSKAMIHHSGDSWARDM